ncbi:MAG: stage II sporulation protein P [Bacillota bacterium]
MNKRKFILLIIFPLLISLLLFVTDPVNAEADMPLELSEVEHGLASGYYTMKDTEDKSVIMMTARIIHVGDEYITGKNIHYIVERVEGNTAWARSRGQIKLSDPPDVPGIFKSGMLPPAAQGNNPPVTIGVFHSHGAEAYVPSDGTESIPEGGGILDVGKAFAAALEDKGLPVNHSTETHVPHDAGAYHRSRRTKEELMRQNSDVFFDVHRDAVPAEQYTEIVEGKPTVQIQFVVGRQNQNLEVNRGFAESLKNVTDQLYPGLIKGIFMARGNYNQDMTPLSLLLEVGSHENTREGAEKSVALFADAVNFYFAGPEGARAQRTAGVTALRTVLWIILIALLAVGAYLLISTGSIEEARAKLRSFMEKEFAEFRGRLKR